MREYFSLSNFKDKFNSSVESGKSVISLVSNELTDDADAEKKEDRGVEWEFYDNLLQEKKQLHAYLKNYEKFVNSLYDM